MYCKFRGMVGCKSFSTQNGIRLRRPVVEKLAWLEREDPGLTSREWQILDLMAQS